MSPAQPQTATASSNDMLLDAVDEQLIVATQTGLPLVERPYHAIAGQLGIPAEEVMARLTRMQQLGVIRRIGAVPNHYTLGFRANGMTVWDVADELAQAAGREVAALDYVSHCYLRPRFLPDWPYNLFAMVHGRDRDEVEAKMSRIEDVLGERSRAHTVLYSSRILKKTGLRISGGS
jgi:DNA-binding Lrp family transcriptional regulator